MATKFQKRHYEHIARSFKALAMAHESNDGVYGYETVSVPLIISTLCSTFKKDNPHFSAETFVDALGLTSECKKNILDLNNV